MADIFTVTAPLKVRLPDGEQKIIAELFKHPRGLLYFDLYWHLDKYNSIHFVEGLLQGDGPWKIADHIIYVLGCQGTDGELASEFQQWRLWRLEHPELYPDKRMIERIASSKGAITNIK